MAGKKDYLSNERVDISDLESDVDSDYEFEAPKSFKKIEKFNKITELSKDSLTNKELWLIKLPSDFNIEKLNKLPVSSNIGSITNFNIKDQEYSLEEDITAQSAAASSVNDSNKNKNKDTTATTTNNNNNNNNDKYSIFISKKNQLKINPNLKFSRFYTISEKIKIPEINYNKVVIQRKDVEKEENLRMRHFPTGYDIDDFEEASQPVIPGKRKHDDEIDEIIGNTNKKSKKSNDDSDDEEDEEEVEATVKESKEDKKSKKDKKDKKHKKHKKKD